MPEHVLMSDIEIITDGGCRRRWSAAENLRIVEETLDDRASNKIVRQMEDRILELERQLGRKTLEAEILREALDKSRSKKQILHVRSPLREDFQ